MFVCAVFFSLLFFVTFVFFFSFCLIFLLVDGVHCDTIQVKGRLQPNVNHLIVKLLRLSATKEDADLQRNASSSNNNNTTGGEESFTGMIAHLKIWRSVLTEQQLRYFFLRQFISCVVRFCDQSYVMLLRKRESGERRERQRVSSERERERGV